MNRIKLKTAAGETDIFIPRTMESLEEVVPAESTVILADENVLTFHSGKLSAYPVIPVAEGESSKSLDTYNEIFQQLLDLNVDRTWNLVGIGGGITTDLAGYVASTFFRGIPFGFVSTTLLGQVDAAIGGKNGINYKGYKNLIGVIRQPDFVFCDTQSLKTLPKKEFIGGFAEIIKYAFIRRPDLYNYLSENLSSAIEYNMESLEYLIKESAQTKVDIVSGDEFEKGDRKLLNFGHTFGHAIEKLYGIAHGDAVAIGMMLACKLSVKLGLADKEIVTKLENLLIAAGLPVSINFDAEQMAVTMARDKKRRKSEIDFILVEETGKAIIHGISVNNINSLLNDLH